MGNGGSDYGSCGGVCGDFREVAMNEEPYDIIKLWTDCVEFDQRMIDSLKEQLNFQREQLKLNKKRLADAIKNERQAA